MLSIRLETGNVILHGQRDWEEGEGRLVHQLLIWSGWSFISLSNAIRKVVALLLMRSVRTSRRVHTWVKSVIVCYILRVTTVIHDDMKPNCTSISNSVIHSCQSPDYLICHQGVQPRGNRGHSNWWNWENQCELLCSLFVCLCNSIYTPFNYQWLCFQSSLSSCSILSP